MTLAPSRIRLEQSGPLRVDEPQAEEVEAAAVQSPLGSATGRLQLADPGPAEIALELEGAGEVASLRLRDHQ